jgi:hypothetical protein
VCLLITSLFPWFDYSDRAPADIWKRADWLGGAGGHLATHRPDRTTFSASVVKRFVWRVAGEQRKPSFK